MRNRDAKEKALEEMKRQAAENGETISDEVVELVKIVLDLEDQAYTAGYEQGFDDGKAVGRGDDYDRYQHEVINTYWVPGRIR